MKKAIMRKHGIAIAHIWFANSIDQQKSDLSLFHEVKKVQELEKENRWMKVSVLNTLITDLSLTEEELWSRIKKNTRYEIRRAEKEGIVAKYYTSKTMPGELIDSFEKMYNQMYQSKGLSTVFDRSLVNMYMDNGMILFSVAYYKNEPLVFHSYLYDETNARFFHSCSSFRTEPDMAEMIGRMNRYLHWQDYLKLKDMGIKTYDWGGINKQFDTAPSNITKFKMAFGGSPEERYNCMAADSLLGKLAFLYFRKTVK